MRKLGGNTKALLFLMMLICLLGAFSGCSTITTLPQSSVNKSNTKSAAPNASRSQNSTFSSASGSTSLIDYDSEKAVTYAITLARYFCKPVDAASQLKNNPHLYEFW